MQWKTVLRKAERVERPPGLNLGLLLVEYAERSGGQHGDEHESQRDDRAASAEMPRSELTSDPQGPGR